MPVAAIALAGGVAGCGSSSPSPAAHPPLLFGVNVHPEQPLRNGGRTPSYDRGRYRRVLARLRAAGTEVVRLQLPWALLEPSKGRYDHGFLRKVDAFVAAARSRGMKVLVTSGGPPCWATSYRAARCGPRYLDGPGASYPPRRLSDESAYAAFIARRWRSDLAGIEVLNEPNHSRHAFFRVPAGTDPAVAYTRIVKATYRGVKRVAPKVPVVAGALALSDGRFLQRMYDAGVKRFSDAISIHPYDVDFGNPFDPWGDPSQPSIGNREDSFASGVPWIHQIMVANGDGSKPLWLTEFGFPDCDPSPLCLDQGTQAAYLRKSFESIRRWPYVKAAIVHTANDVGPDRRLWSASFGLLRSDLSRRPAYCVYAAAAGHRGCHPDPPAPEQQAQEDLTGAWQLARAYASANEGSFVGFAPALASGGRSYSSYRLLSRDVKPSRHAKPTRIAVYVNRPGTTVQLCNSSRTTAYCVVQVAAGDRSAVTYGKSKAGTWAAAAATNRRSSTSW